MATNYVSPWQKDFKEGSLSRGSLFDLMDGKIPYLGEPGFLPRNIAPKLEDVLSPQLTPYIHATGPPLLKVGVAQFQFRAQSETDVQNRPDDGMSPRGSVRMKTCLENLT